MCRARLCRARMCRARFCRARFYRTGPGWTDRQGTSVSR
ncbi:MAG: hypothetical protein ACK4YM_10560 [Novosphingobium sp.]